MTSVDDTHIDPYRGRRVAGRYVLLELIGAGAMGRVYRAHHADLDKVVAVKVLNAQIAADPQAVERFKLEAKAAARLDHANSMQIHDSGRDDPDGLLYLVMEFLEGYDLESALRAVPLFAPDRAVRIMVQVLAALGAAHDQGIVHRDMKPGNIMLVRRRVEDQLVDEFVKVCDFGLAKVASPEDRGQAALTKTGMVFGTPTYMSPEQAQGDRADARTDLYACGVILYRMLSGRVPFEAESILGVLMKHVTDPPPTFAAFGVPVDPALEGIVQKALIKDREFRYQTAREMRADLNYLAEQRGWLHAPSAPFGRVEQRDLPGPNSFAPGLLPGSPSLSGGRLVQSHPSVSFGAERISPLSAPLGGLTMPPNSTVARIEPRRSALGTLGAFILGLALAAGLGLYGADRMGLLDPTPVSEPLTGAVPSELARAPVDAKPAVLPPTKTPEAAPAVEPPKAEAKPVKKPKRPPRTNGKAPVVAPVDEAPDEAEPETSPPDSELPAAESPAPEEVEPPPAAEVPPPAAEVPPPAPEVETKPEVPAPSPEAVEEKLKAVLGAKFDLVQKVKDVSLTGGGSTGKVRGALKRLNGNFGVCLRPAVAGGPPGKGDLKIRAEIEPTGSVRDVQVEGPLPAAHACIVSTVRLARFPRPDTGAAWLSFTLHYNAQP